MLAMPSPTPIYTLSLHDALPILHFEGDWQQVLDVDPNTLALTPRPMPAAAPRCNGTAAQGFIYDLGHPDVTRSEEHTSELQSHSDIVCRLLLEKKNKQTKNRRRP